MTMKPIGENILLLMREEDITNETGLRMAHSEGEKTEARALLAEVIQVGEECQKNIKPGQLVYVGKWEIQHCVIEGTKYAVCKEKDVLLVGGTNAK